ncbi:MAG: hypothetical protein U9N04_02515 [Patescibacteria group bacterium]|nr:hypothetical protein [Patescibacteria group bacterium]
MVFIQAPKSRKYEENTKSGKRISLSLLQKDICKQLKIVLAKIIIIIIAITETINDDKGRTIEAIKNDKGVKEKIKIANAINLKDIFLSRTNIFRKARKYIIKTRIPDIAIIKKPKGNNFS